MSEAKGFIGARFSRLLGRYRGYFLPFGYFAAVAVGLHVGAGQLDDRSFLALNQLDAWVDQLAAGLIQAVGGWLGASDLEYLSFRAATLIDFDEKLKLARLVALVWELLAVLLLGLPVFLYRAGSLRIRELKEPAEKRLRDPTLLTVALPLMVGAASLAGVFAIAAQVQVLVHGEATDWRLPEDYAALAASAVGFFALALGLWRLCLPAVLGAFRFASRRADNDRTLMVKERSRRLRGALTVLVTSPLLWTAIVATPILGTVRALLWM